jgi:hypothetical protein
MALLLRFSARIPRNGSMGLVPDFRFILKEEQVNMQLPQFYRILSCASGTCVDGIHR